MKDMYITVIVKPYQLQILTHGCHYTCPISKVGGIWRFKFKGQWFNVDDYTDERTQVNNSLYKGDD